MRALPPRRSRPRRLAHAPSAGAAEPAQPTAYGIVFAPFGLSLQLPVARDVELFGAGAVGALWFNRSVPVPNARAFNVTLEWGGGIDLPIASAQHLRLGYKFHHLSNVYSALENPGIDANVFYVGWVLKVRAPR